MTQQRNCSARLANKPIIKNKKVSHQSNTALKPSAENNHQSLIWIPSFLVSRPYCFQYWHSQITIGSGCFASSRRSVHRQRRASPRFCFFCFFQRDPTFGPAVHAGLYGCVELLLPVAAQRCPCQWKWALLPWQSDPSFTHKLEWIDRRRDAERGVRGMSGSQRSTLKTESNTDGFGPPGFGPAHR